MKKTATMKKAAIKIKKIKKPKPKEFWVELSYVDHPNYIDMLLDESLEKLAEEMGGRFSGSGYDLLECRRDLNYCFKTRKKALEFLATAKRKRNVKISGEILDMASKSVKLRFSAQGIVNQTVEIVDSSITPDILIKMLKNGEAVTTIQEGGNVEITSSKIMTAGKRIAIVVDIDNELEYEDFELM